MLILMGYDNIDSNVKIMTEPKLCCNYCERKARWESNEMKKGRLIPHCKDETREQSLNQNNEGKIAQIHPDS